MISSNHPVLYSDGRDTFLSACLIVDSCAAALAGCLSRGSPYRILTKRRCFEYEIYHKRACRDGARALAHSCSECHWLSGPGRSGGLSPHTSHAPAIRESLARRGSFIQVDARPYLLQSGGRAARAAHGAATYA